MAWRTQKQQQSTTQEDAEPLEWTAPQTESLDEILAEIDSVLESNAEEFVRSFVQKGGQ